MFYGFSGVGMRDALILALETMVSGFLVVPNHSTHTQICLLRGFLLQHTQCLCRWTDWREDVTAWSSDAVSCMK